MSISKMTIKKNMKLRNFIVTGIISLVLWFLFNSPGTLMINGKAIDSFQIVISFLLPIATFFGCIIATFISAQSIPNEYESSRNHLVKIRGINQKRYHSEIMIGNIISSIMYYLVLFVPVVVVSFRYSFDENILKFLILFLISCTNISLVSLLSTTISNIGGFMLGAIGGIIFTIVGSMYNVLGFLKEISEGLLFNILNVVLKIFPNMAGVLKFGQDYLFGNSLKYQVFIYMGILSIIAVILLLAVKRKND